jgi:hypothetical protein
MIVNRKLRSTSLLQTSAFLAFTIGAYGQSSTAIQGVRVLSSTFDPQTRIVKVIFVNDSPADITAYGVFLEKHFQNSQRAAWTGGAAWGRDFVRPAAHQLDTKQRSALQRSDQPIHPGQTAEESSDLSGEQDLVSASMRIDMVAYSDGTAEVENEVTFRRLLISRQADLLAARKAAGIGTSVLSNKGNSHPLATLTARLREARAMAPATSFQGPEAEGFARSWEESLDVLIAELEKPGSGTYMHTTTRAPGASRPGGSRERGYVRDFVEAQMQHANILAKHTEIRRINP